MTLLRYMWTAPVARAIHCSKLAFQALRPTTNCVAKSATRLPWKRADASAVSSGLRAPLLLVNDAPYGLPALN
jgi:hypothetical protein